MKHVQLTAEQRQELEAAMKGKHLSGRYLKRLQSIRLNDRGYKVASISELLEVHYNSVRTWLKRYEQGGLAALAEKPREGRPRLLSEEQETQVRLWVDEEPRLLKRVRAKVASEFEQSISVDTLKRTLKSNRLKSQAP
jgi:transposase